MYMYMHMYMYMYYMYMYIYVNMYIYIDMYISIYFSQVDLLGVRYEFVNVRAKTSPGAPNW